jgi:nucleobase:cation symporter-1, NCS1 family
MSLDEQQLPEVARAFRVESHGTDFIPASERWAKPRDLFGMWAGASFQVEYFVYGVVLMTFGVSFAQAAVITILGNLSYVLLGIASLQGPETGTTVFAINRASYGPQGSRMLSLFNWLTQVGFETEGLILVVFAGEALAIKAGFLPGTALKVVFIAIAAVIQFILPSLGHATIVKSLRTLIAPFIVLYAILAALTLGKVNVHLVHAGGNWETFMGGLAFVIVLSGLGWTECGNDYSRYLPANSSKKAIVGWVFLGTALPEILVMLLGCAVGTYATALSQNSSGDPFAAFTASHNTVFASGFVVPFLIFAILQLFSINSLDLYSSGVTLQALGLRVKRWQAVFVDTVICAGLTVYAIFDSSFSTLLKDFVDVLVIWIAPWCAIFLVDWVLRRYRYSPENLQRTDSTSIYWRSGGIHWPAIIAQLIGMLAALECLAATFSLPKWLHIVNYHFGGQTTPAYGADFSVFAGMLAGGFVYLVLAGAKVRREGNAEVASSRDSVSSPS